MLFSYLNGKEIQKREYVCINIDDSLCCTVETNNIVKQLYSKKINLKIKKIKITECKRTCVLKLITKSFKCSLKGYFFMCLYVENLLVFSNHMFVYYSVQFSPVAQSCPTLCDPINRRMPGLPVHHHLLEFTITKSKCSIN